MQHIGMVPIAIIELYISNDFYCRSTAEFFPYMYKSAIFGDKDGVATLALLRTVERGHGLVARRIVVPTPTVRLPLSRARPPQQDDNVAELLDHDICNKSNGTPCTAGVRIPSVYHGDGRMTSTMEPTLCDVTEGGTWTDGDQQPSDR